MGSVRRVYVEKETGLCRCRRKSCVMRSGSYLGIKDCDRSDGY